MRRRVPATVAVMVLLWGVWWVPWPLGWGGEGLVGGSWCEVTVVCAPHPLRVVCDGFAGGYYGFVGQFGALGWGAAVGHVDVAVGVWGTIVGCSVVGGWRCGSWREDGDCHCRLGLVRNCS